MRLRLVDKRVFLQLEKRSLLVRQILEKALRKHHAVRRRLSWPLGCLIFESQASLTLHSAGTRPSRRRLWKRN